MERESGRPQGGAVIELTGNRFAVIDGCDGVLDYNEEQVLVRAGRLTVRFAGQGLRVKRLTENAAVLEGTIRAVEYSY